MRVTGPLLIAMGLLLLLNALATSGAGIISEGLDLTIRNYSRDFSERLTRDELARAFDQDLVDVPEDSAARVEWIEDRFARYWSRELRRFASRTVKLSFLLGIACIVWGITDVAVTRRRRSSSAEA